MGSRRCSTTSLWWPMRGLLLAGTVMDRLGLEAMLDEVVRPPAAGRGVRREGAVGGGVDAGGAAHTSTTQTGCGPAVLPFAVAAPSTVGTWLRSFTLALGHELHPSPAPRPQPPPAHLRAHPRDSARPSTHPKRHKPTRNPPPPAPHAPTAPAAHAPAQHQPTTPQPATPPAHRWIQAKRLGRGHDGVAGRAETLPFRSDGWAAGRDPGCRARRVGGRAGGGRNPGRLGRRCGEGRAHRRRPGPVVPVHSRRGHAHQPGVRHGQPGQSAASPWTSPPTTGGP